MFDNFLGNNDIKIQFKKILNEYNKDLPNILIGGNDSNGKSTLKDIFLKELKNVNSSIEIYNIKNIKEIYRLLKLSKNKIIVMDDIISLSIKEQNELNMILKMIYDKSNVSFYISLNVIDNIIPELFDIMFIFKLKLVSKNELFKYIKSKMIKKISDDKIYEIITLSNYNIRKVNKLIYKYNIEINIDLLDKDVFEKIYDSDINKYINNCKNMYNSGIMIFDIMENFSYNIIKNKMNIDILKIKDIYKILVEYQIIFYKGNIAEIQFLAMMIKIHDIINDTLR